MQCPSCGHDENHVIDNKSVRNINWRRRECDDCGHRWWTSEIEDEPVWGGLTEENTAPVGSEPQICR